MVQGPVRTLSQARPASTLGGGAAMGRGRRRLWDETISCKYIEMRLWVDLISCQEQRLCDAPVSHLPHQLAGQFPWGSLEEGLRGMASLALDLRELGGKATHLSSSPALLPHFGGCSLLQDERQAPFGRYGGWVSSSYLNDTLFSFLFLFKWTSGTQSWVITNPGYDILIIGPCRATLINEVISLQ